MSMQRKLHKFPIGRSGIERKPVLLHKDGSLEDVQLTPQFGGFLAVSRDIPIFFELGRWASDAGYPKLRWVEEEKEKRAPQH